MGNGRHSCPVLPGRTPGHWPRPPRLPLSWGIPVVPGDDCSRDFSLGHVAPRGALPFVYLLSKRLGRHTHCCKSPGNTCGFVVTGLDILRSRVLCPQISGPHLASLSGHVVVPGVGVASSLAAPGSAHHGVAPVPPVPQRAGRCAPCPSTPWGSFCRGGAGGRAAPGPGGRCPPPWPPPPSGVCAVPWPQLLLCVPSVHVSLRGAHTFVTFFAS